MRVSGFAFAAFLLAASASARRTIYACPNTLLTTTTTATSSTTSTQTSSSLSSIESTSASAASTSSSTTSSTTSSTSSTTLSTITTITTTTTTTSIETSTSASTSASSTASTSTTAAPSLYYLQARSSSSSRFNGNYVRVAAGVMDFTGGSQAEAAGFLIDLAGRLLYNGLYAQTASSSGSLSQIQFNNPVGSLSRRQAANALYCTATTTAAGESVMSCSAAGLGSQRLCGSTFYLAAGEQCLPLTVGYIAPGAPTPGYTPSGSGTPTASFTIQNSVSGLYLGYKQLYPGATAYTFSAVSATPPLFSLDGSGHLVSYGPSPRGGATVFFTAVLPASITNGGTVIAEYEPRNFGTYVALICQLLTNPGTLQASLSCTDGASGVNTQLQLCSAAGDVYLAVGPTVGSGCSVPTFNVAFSSS